MRAVLIVIQLRPMPWPDRMLNLLLTRLLGRYSEEVKDIRSNLKQYA